MKHKNKYTGKGIGVAVLDTGIYPHMDFDRRIICFQDFVQKRANPYDDNGHGTHVAGIIAGSGRASQGACRGLAPESNLICLKVLDAAGNGMQQNTIRSLEWILGNYKRYGVRIVNISVGSVTKNYRQHDGLIRAVERVWDEGLVVVTAAGNGGPNPGSITAPGSSKKVITVGSSDMLNHYQRLSGTGPTSECICKPDIVCRGHDILSCKASPGGREYTRKSGTSMSTPYISGAAALALEKDPLLTNVEIKMMLRECARDLGLPHNRQGWGEFDLEKFLSY
ncbi:MAG: S8 family peptidase [Ruminococcus sp.]|jgi:serine protease AprX